MNSVSRTSIAYGLIVFGLGGCSRLEEVGSAFATESNHLQVLTTPAGAWLSECGTPKKGSQSVVQEWTVTTRGSWAEYVPAVLRALEPSYHCSPTGNETTLCSRASPGDSFQLEFVSERAALELVVHIHFEARAD